MARASKWYVLSGLILTKCKGPAQRSCSWHAANKEAPCAFELRCLQLCDLYENDCIFDKFDCCMNGSASYVASGSYSNTFKVFKCGEGAQGIPLEASRDPMRRRLQPAQKVRQMACVACHCRSLHYKQQHFVWRCAAGSVVYAPPLNCYAVLSGPVSAWVPASGLQGMP
jgi:hypothetical protein